MIKKNSGKKPQEEKRARLVNMKQWILEKEGQLKLFGLTFLIIIATNTLCIAGNTTYRYTRTDDNGITHIEKSSTNIFVWKDEKGTTNYKQILQPQKEQTKENIKDIDIESITTELNQ